MNKNRILTVKDLLNFCKSNEVYSFNSKEFGKQLVVQCEQDASEFEIEDNGNLLLANVKVCHTLLNRNGSYCSEESMKEAMPTLKYAPFLAYIHQLDDGTYDFHAHDGHYEEDENGEEVWVYDEQQVGTFTADEPYLQYDEEMDKTYVHAKVAIPRNYSKASEIIESRKTTKVSCELSIDEFAYNAKEGYLELKKFTFLGVTALGKEKNGKEIGEGMLGSKLSLEDFSAENNSIVKFTKQLEDMQEKINVLISHFDTNKNEKFEDNFGKEEITMDGNKNESGEFTTGENNAVSENNSANENNQTSGVTSENSENQTENTVENSDENHEENSEENSEGTTEGSVDENKKKKKRCSIEIGEDKKSFEISLDERIYALRDLVNTTYSESDNTYYSITAYEDYVVMHDWFSTRHYKQTYSEENDVITLTGDRVQVYATYLTQEELDIIENQKSEYAELKTYKENTEKEKAHSEKENLLNSDKFSMLKEVKEFKELFENMDNYSLVDLEKEAKVIKSDYADSIGTFSNKTEPKKNSYVFMASRTSEPKVEKDPYNGIFNKYKK